MRRGVALLTLLFAVAGPVRPVESAAAISWVERGVTELVAEVPVDYAKARALVPPRYTLALSGGVAVIVLVARTGLVGASGARPASATIHEASVRLATSESSSRDGYLLWAITDNQRLAGGLAALGLPSVYDVDTEVRYAPLTPSAATLVVDNVLWPPSRYHLQDVFHEPSPAARDAAGTLTRYFHDGPRGRVTVELVCAPCRVAEPMATVVEPDEDSRLWSYVLTHPATTGSATFRRLDQTARAYL